jgi:hypothetical protein
MDAAFEGETEHVQSPNEGYGGVIERQTLALRAPGEYGGQQHLKTLTAQAGHIGGVEDEVLSPVRHKIPMKVGGGFQVQNGRQPEGRTRRIVQGTTFTGHQNSSQVSLASTAIGFSAAPPRPMVFSAGAP